MAEETPIWTGSPSQKTNIGFFLLTFILIIPPIVRYLKTKFTRYEITTQRIIFHSGVFSRRREELELYRVKDYRVIAPLLYRMFGLENVILETSDRTTPEITLPNPRSPDGPDMGAAATAAPPRESSKTVGLTPVAFSPRRMPPR